MRVCIQVRQHGAIISEYFASWTEFANDKLTEVPNTWAAPVEEDIDKTDHRHGGVSGLTLNVHEVNSGRIVYDQGVDEFGPGPYWKTDREDDVIPGVQMECLLYVDGGVGVIFLDEDGYVDEWSSSSTTRIIRDIEDRVLGCNNFVA